MDVIGPPIDRRPEFAVDDAVVGIDVDPDVLERAGELINQSTVSGPRYPERTQQEIDTEQFEEE